MGYTQIQKILLAHGGKDITPGAIVDIEIDARIARDFGGANVVKNIQDNDLDIHDPSKTFFTFDCNPGGSDQKYATNQQICRAFARKHSIKIYDIDSGIGTHIAIDEGLIGPGGTLVSTDSHANILGAIGAFGQGMGDLDVAQAFAEGRTWFKVPMSMKLVLKGKPSSSATAKDIVLAMAKELGANGLLGYSAEIQGDIVDSMSLADRITISSMVTEMGGIIGLFQPSPKMIEEFRNMGLKIPDMTPDPDAEYHKEVVVNIDGLGPMTARPGHPDDVIPVSEAQGRKIDSVFIGSCTNGRYEDMAATARILKGKKIAPGVVLKIVPSTRGVWERCLKEGLLTIMTDAGALIGNPGCAGCAAGQIGQNGPGEVVVSTGNRNFPGKQGKGEVYLASPETAAASAIAGILTTADNIPEEPAVFHADPSSKTPKETGAKTAEKCDSPLTVKGRAWIISKDNIDTDMIFHNRYLTITDIAQMGQYTFDNLEGHEDFASKAKPGDILITGKNFGCGSSRQQAVDCFKSLGTSVIMAESFGAIYERNAINAGMPIMNGELVNAGIKDGDELEVNMAEGTVKNITQGKEYSITPFSDVQIEIYRRGGLLSGVC